MMSVHLLLNRLAELEGSESFPTQYDAFMSWYKTVGFVIQDIKETSLDTTDKEKREQQLMKDILSRNTWNRL